MQTTLCYIEKDNHFLMMHRTKKENDMNMGKWIGLGGKLFKGENPEECLVREIKEEINVELTKFTKRGTILFINQDYYTEIMHLYTATQFLGEVDMNCIEGELSWIHFDDVLNLTMWEGDRYFLEKLINGEPYFTMKLCYNEDKLIEAYCNNEKIK